MSGDKSLFYLILRRVYLVFSMLLGDTLAEYVPDCLSYDHFSESLAAVLPCCVRLADKDISRISFTTFFLFSQKPKAYIDKATSFLAQCGSPCLCF